MKNLKKALRVVVLFILVMTMCTATAFAAVSSEDVTYATNYLIKNSTVDAQGTITYTSKVMSIVTNGTVATGGTSVTLGNTSVMLDDKAIVDLASLAKAAEKASQVQEKIDGIGNMGGIQADLGGTQSIIDGFAPFLSLFMGAMVYVAIFGMGISTALDVCFMSLPFFRNKCDDAVASGNGAMTKTGKDGETQLRWVSSEAQYAVKVCTLENGKLPYGIYIKKRILAYVLVSIIIFILLTGRIDMIVSIALKAVSGLFDVLSTLSI